MLHALPPEILSMVLEYCCRKEDLKNLCLVSKALHNATIPQLYRSIILFSRNEDNLSDLNVGPLLERGARYLKFTREVILIAEFRELLRHRCHDHYPGNTDDEYDEYDSSSDENDLEYRESPQRLTVGEDANGRSRLHEDDQEIQPGEWTNDRSEVSLDDHPHVDSPEGGSDDLTWQEWTPHEQFMQILESRIQPLLDLIPEGRLERFSWNLGTCLPETVIEYVRIKQPQIVCLEIVTDTTCLGQGFLNICDLYGLNSLRRLRWVTCTGIDDPLLPLGELLRNNALALEEIEIDEVRQGGMNRSLVRRNELLQEVLALPPGEMQQLFPLLKSLTLSAISLENGCDVVPFVFSLNCLHSLALRNCREATGLLKALGSDDVLPHSMRLKSFEYLDNGMSEYLDTDTFEYLDNGTLGELGAMVSLANFLISFEGLQDLFLSCLDVFDNRLLSSISNHKSSLRRLLCHIPQITPLRNSVQRSLRFQSSLLTQLLSETPNLICLGLSYSPEDLRSLFSLPKTCPRLRLLHVRAFGWLAYEYREGLDDKSESKFSAALTEIRELASWAFGPEGLPSLQVLAYGDFSYRGRRPNLVLCRSKPLDDADIQKSAAGLSGLAYREVTKADVSVQEILYTNAHFLEACPEDSLLYERNRPF